MIAPVVVAALVNRNDAVALIDAVSDHATSERRPLGTLESCRSRSSTFQHATLVALGSSTASITSTMSFPFASAATITGTPTTTATITEPSSHLADALAVGAPGRVIRVLSGQPIPADNVSPTPSLN